jgi:hypothetical protein
VVFKEIIIEKCILDESTSKVTYSTVLETKKERPLHSELTKKFSEPILLSRDDEVHLMDYSFAKDSSDEDNDDDDDEEFNSSLCDRRKTKKKISFHRHFATNKVSEESKTSISSRHRKSSRSTSDQNDIIEMTHASNENSNIVMACEEEEEEDIRKVTKNSVKEKEKSEKPKTTKSSLTVTRKRKATSPPPSEVKDEPILIEDTQSKSNTKGKKSALKTTPKTLSRTAAGLKAIDTLPQSVNIIHDTKDQLKKYPPRYLYNNRYKKVDDDDENDDEESGEPEREYAIKTRKHSASYGSSKKKEQPSKASTLPKPPIVAPSSTFTHNLAKLKYNLKPSEKREDLEKLKSDSSLLLKKKANEDEIIAECSPKESSHHKRKDSETSDLAIMELQYPPLDIEANLNHSEARDKYSSNQASPNAENVEQYENANIVQNEVTIDNSDTHYDDDDGDNSHFNNLIMPSVPDKKIVHSSKTKKVNSSRSKRECLISTDEILNYKLSPVSQTSDLWMKLKILKPSFDCRINVKRLNDQSINYYFKKHHIQIQTSNRILEPNELVFVPVGKDFYKVALVKNKIYEQSDSTSSSQTRKYTCMILKPNQDSSIDCFTEETDYENNDWVTFATNEIIPIDWLRETDEVEVIEDNNLNKKARFLSLQADCKHGVVLELRKNRSQIK